MSSTPAFPPLDGSLSVVPGFVDFQATNNAQHPWTVFAPDSPVSSISFEEYADATHRIANVFRPDGTNAKGEIVALILHCDSVLYLATLAGLIRAGFVPFPMSPKNSVPAFMNLLEKTGCHRIISQPIFAPLVNAVKDNLNEKNFAVQIDDLPSLHDIFPNISGNAGSSKPKPFPGAAKAFNNEDIVLYLHSSGSTGYPKPIPQTQRVMLQWCSTSVIFETRKRAVIWGSMALPTFHTIGIFMQFYSPLASSYPVGLYAPMAPAPPVAPTPNNLLEAIKGAKADAIPIIPAIVEAWAQNEEHVKFLATLKILCFAGGPLSVPCGEKLIKAGVRLCAVFGQTETGVHSKIFDAVDTHGPEVATVKTSADWEWIAFPDYLNCRWVPQGDGTYELQFLRCDKHWPAVENLPDTRGYATSDLWAPHPTKKGLWKITGRKDDVLVLGTAEKVVPIPQEGIIMAHPAISGAVMFGRGKHGCGVLLELRPTHAFDPKDSKALVEFRNTIWSTVQEANVVAPTFARIFKEMIIVADPSKPLPRAAKGTVVRPQALNLYADEIEKLYETVADSADARGIAPPVAWTVDEIEPWLMRHCESVNDGVAIAPERDMFDQGFDSLHATFLRNRILGTLRASKEPVVQDAVKRLSLNFVFEHPTVRALAGAIAAAVAPEAQAVSPKDAQKEIRDMIDHYAAHLPKPSYTAKEEREEDIVVLVTGTTGNVGSHVLAALLAEPKVKKVYTLNRPSSIQDRQAVAFKDRGLSTNLLSDGRLVELSGDVTQDTFGLDSAALAELTQNITHIVHNAWRVDFNLALSSFEKYIAGTRRLIDLCCATPRSIKVLFTSSIAATHMWDPAQGAVPEEVLGDAAVGVASGYGASKFVAENLLAKAAENGVECTTLRVGQVCGSSKTGAWGTSEWVPILVKSSIALGVIPNLDGVVSWIPIDTVASAVTDLVTARVPLPRLVNVVHPRPTSWSDVFAHVGAGLGREPFPVVPFDEWIAALEAEAGKQDVERVPALKILQFLRGIAANNVRSTQREGVKTEAGGLPVYETAKLLEFCPSVRELQPLGEAHAHAWVAYWRALGFLNL